MDGTVNVSILQWESLRAELDALKKSNAELKENEKRVELTIIDRASAQHLRYNRWTDCNEFVSTSHVVKDVKYTGFDDVQRILYAEAEDKVQKTINDLNMKIATLQVDINNLKIVATQTAELHNTAIRQTTAECEKTAKLHAAKLQEEITELQAIIENRKIQSESEAKDELIKKLQDELATAKLPWWKR